MGDVDFRVTKFRVRFLFLCGVNRQGRFDLRVCVLEYIMCNSTGRCIPESWKCDGDPDCGIGDNSDEPPECSKYLCVRCTLNLY